MTRQRAVVGVHRFARLKVDVWVLTAASQHRMFRAEGPSAMGHQRLIRNQLLEHRIAEGHDLLDLVGGAKTVEGMHKRQAAQQTHGRCDGSPIAGLLHRSSDNHATTRPTGRHDIGVIAKDRQALGGERSGSHMQHNRSELPRPFVEIGDHQQQPLAGGKAGAEGTGLQGSMQRASHAGLALQLHHLGHAAPQIGARLCSPPIGPFTHG